MWPNTKTWWNRLKKPQKRVENQEPKRDKNNSWLVSDARLQNNIIKNWLINLHMRPAQKTKLIRL